MALIPSSFEFDPEFVIEGFDLREGDATEDRANDDEGLDATEHCCDRFGPGSFTGGV